MAITRKKRIEGLISKTKRIEEIPDDLQAGVELVSPVIEEQAPELPAQVVQLIPSVVGSGVVVADRPKVGRRRG